MVESTKKCEQVQDSEEEQDPYAQERVDLLGKMAVIKAQTKEASAKLNQEDFSAMSKKKKA